MTALAPCPHCMRHVATHETACPFCARELARGRARHVVLGRVSRAAVFSAALAACSQDKPKPPAPPPPARGSDDLEKLLDHQPRVVDEPAPTAAPPPVDAGVAAPIDAAVVDAGAPDAGVPVKKKKQQKVQKIEDVKIEIDHRHMAKPYGAPPARRRIV